MNMYSIKHPMSTKDNVKMSIEAYNESLSVASNKAQEAYNESVENANNSVYNTMVRKESKQNTYSNFSEDVKTALLCECIYKIYKEGSGIGIHHENDDNIAKNLIANIVAENGVNSILRNMSRKNITVSELANLITTTHKKILEKCDKENCDTLTIPSDIRDEFFDKLNMCDTGEAGASINMRVSSALDEFIQNNVEMKEEIEKYMRETQEKVSVAKTVAAKEAAEFRCKSNINNVRNKTSNNVFGAMVSTMSESVMKNPDLLKQFMNENKVDFQKIVDRSKIMYSVLETMNTLDIIKVDEFYIQGVLNGLKN